MRKWILTTSIAFTLGLSAPVFAGGLDSLTIKLGSDKGGGSKASAPAKIPKGHKPPPGKCRIWYKGRPVNKQPPVGNCKKLKKNVPAGAVLIRG